MKISEKFNLHKTQRELDFVDIDLEEDLPIFLDPHYLSFRQSDLANEANYCIHTFFDKLVLFIKSNKLLEAKQHMSYIGELNEVHLGLSKNKSMGRGIGDINSDAIIGSLIDSNAVKTGLIEKLEDTRLFICGVGADKISDLCANVIKKVLLQYTKNQCDLWGIPTQKAQSGIYWDSEKYLWINDDETDRLIIGGKLYLLVPKEFVSYRTQYTPEKYVQHFVLNFLQEDQLRINSNLVKVSRDKKTKRIIKKWVTKKSVVNSLKKEGINIYDKEWLIKFSLEHKEILDEFRANIGPYNKLFNGDFEKPEEIIPILDALISSLKKIPSGNENFSKYENLIKGISELLFYPDLTNPKRQVPINDGRKIVDLVFANVAKGGPFYYLKNEDDYPSNYITMECKNYSKDISNPELDQMIGRFSNNRGKVGIIFCRGLDNPELFLKRTQDAFKDNQGLIIHLTDDDLIELLTLYKSEFELSYREFISRRIDLIRYS